MSNESNATVPMNAFSLACIKSEVGHKPGENVLISPTSIMVVFGMVANGARKATLKGIKKALGVTGDQCDVNPAYEELLTSLKRAGIGVRLDIANAIFARQGVGFHTSFMETNKQFFGATIEEMDFDAPASPKRLNQWVSDGTNKMIPTIVDEEEGIDPNTVMFLMNVVYFKGDWNVKFDKAETTTQPFATPTGPVDVQLMHRGGDMAYGKDWLEDYSGHNYEWVSLPFGDSKEVRAVVILPGEGKTTDDVLAALTPEKFGQIAKSEYESDGNLWLPRIDIEYSNELNETLKALGMEEAFDGRADFSGMRQVPPVLKITKVQHKTKFKVDEEGAEAAAVTSVEVGLESCVQPFSMRCDKPFLMFLVDTKTEAVLFGGVINNPTK